MNNPEKLATNSTQDTGKINVREHRMGNQNGQSRETSNTANKTQDEDKQKKNTR